jgi:hypothetical protein
MIARKEIGVAPSLWCFDIHCCTKNLLVAIIFPNASGGLLRTYTPYLPTIGLFILSARLSPSDIVTKVKLGSQGILETSPRSSCKHRSSIRYDPFRHAKQSHNIAGKNSS